MSTPSDDDRTGEEPTDEEIDTWLRVAGLPARTDQEFRFHDYSGFDLETAFLAGWRARAARDINRTTS
jgi:hypothetical protein